MPHLQSSQTCQPILKSSRVSFIITLRIVMSGITNDKRRICQAETWHDIHWTLCLHRLIVLIMGLDDRLFIHILSPIYHIRSLCSLIVDPLASDFIFDISLFMLNFFYNSLQDLRLKILHLSIILWPLKKKISTYKSPINQCDSHAL